MVSGGQLYLRFDTRLYFINSALKVSPADAEFDGDVTRVVFTVNEGRAGLPGDFRELFEGNAFAVGTIDLDGADRFDDLAILRQASHDDVETLFTVEQLRHGLAADCGLRRCVDFVRR